MSLTRTNSFVTYLIRVKINIYIRLENITLERSIIIILIIGSIRILTQNFHGH